MTRGLAKPHLVTRRIVAGLGGLLRAVFSPLSASGTVTKSPNLSSDVSAFSPKARRAPMKNNRPLDSLLLLLFQFLVEQAVIRHTVNICTAAGCKWVATTLVESLFSHHIVALFVFSGALNLSLILYGIHLILKTLEEHLKLPVSEWLDWLYHHMMPKGGAGKPEQSPAKLQKPAQRKTVKAPRRKPTTRRRPAKAALDAPDPAGVIPAAVPPPAKPRRVPRRNKNQALDS
jgi:hypothetical protein